MNTTAPQRLYAIKHLKKSVTGISLSDALKGASNFPAGILHNGKKYWDAEAVDRWCAARNIGKGATK